MVESLGPMGRVTKVNILMVLKMVKVFSNGTMETRFMVNFMIIIFRERVPICGKMAVNLKEIGWITKSKDRAYSHGQTEGGTREAMSTTRKMAKELSSGPMVVSIQVVGNVARWMARAYMYPKMAKSALASGKTVREYTG